MKVLMFAWRFFFFKIDCQLGRIYFKEGLFITHEKSQFCVSGCGLQKFENHLFLTYGLFGLLI